jgi:flagellar hook protein FlgE
MDPSRTSLLQTLNAKAHPRSFAEFSQPQASCVNLGNSRELQSMSLYGVMRTSSSGMAAQASRISTVAENVANSNTTGYKAVRAEFSSLVVDDAVGSFNSGSVTVDTHQLVSGQGTLTATNSLTDLGIQGTGFFVVQGPGGQSVMTRAGSFTPNQSGDLVNTAGFKLMGYPLVPNQPNIVVNGFTGMVPINVNSNKLSAVPSTTGTFQANFPSGSTAVAAANLPSTNSATATFTAKSSLVVIGNQGQEITLDLYSTMTGPNTWEVAAYNRADAGINGTFPYASGPLATQTLQFDPNNGQLASGSPSSISLSVPGGQPLTLDMASTSQLATAYSVIQGKVNGNRASVATLTEIDKDGTVYVAFDNGTRQAVYRIPLAIVASPDHLQSSSGNVFSPSGQSGDPHVGFPQDAGFGSINSGVLEQSTADIASEFTDMIDAQRGYTANSKVFQTGADLMDVLVNLKR